jgi:hypothetical protein
MLLISKAVGVLAKHKMHVHEKGLDIVIRTYVL